MLTNISLTKKEDKLISLLLEFSEAINQGQESKLAIRIVGGWVRDKLLNRESDDIDLMITKMRALEFIKALSIYLKNKQIDITFGIIKSNENKLKLIESANFTIDNLKVDVIDLFNYLEPTDDKSTVCDSLIYEDTMRRDITINSLYYNIHTKQIEDFTNMGINDLNNKIIRTCRQAKYFFLKDPFSLLRSIRFSTILQFKLDDDIIEAAKAEQVKVLLKNKIAKERIGREVNKITKNKNCISGFELIQELDLYNTLFCIKSIPSLDSSSINFNLIMAKNINSLIKNAVANESVNLLLENYPQIQSNLNKLLSPWLLLAGYLISFSNVYLKSNSTPRCVVKKVLKGEVRLPQSQAVDFIVYLFQAYFQLNQLLSLNPAEWTRSNIGLFVKKYGDKLYETILFLISEELSRLEINIIKQEQLNSLISQMGKLLDFINKESLDKVHLIPPILSGAQIQSTLPLNQSRYLKAIKLKLDIHHLLNPDISQQQAILWLKSNFSTQDLLDNLASSYNDSQQNQI